MKTRTITMRFRKNAPEHNLLAAVQHWVKANGGNLLVVGGIEVEFGLHELPKFKVAVRCLGKPPERIPDGARTALKT